MQCCRLPRILTQGEFRSRSWVVVRKPKGPDQRCEVWYDGCCGGGSYSLVNLRFLKKNRMTMILLISSYAFACMLNFGSSASLSQPVEISFLETREAGRSCAEDSEVLGYSYRTNAIQRNSWVDVKLCQVMERQHTDRIYQCLSQRLSALGEARIPSPPDTFRTLPLIC